MIPKKNAKKCVTGSLCRFSTKISCSLLVFSTPHIASHPLQILLINILPDSSNLCSLLFYWCFQLFRFRLIPHPHPTPLSFSTCALIPVKNSDMQHPLTSQNTSVLKGKIISCLTTGTQHTNGFHHGVESSWNVMAHGDAREEKWRGNWRMEWVTSTLKTTSEHGVSSITTADAHTSAASSRLNWRPCPI